MPAPQKGERPVMCSPRGVLPEARREIVGRSNLRQAFTLRISRAQRDYRRRSTPKQKRQWPRRKDHVPPQPPLLLRLTDAQKTNIHEYLQAA